jgi:hypothetical protein
MDPQSKICVVGAIEAIAIAVIIAANACGRMEASADGQSLTFEPEPLKFRSLQHSLLAGCK